MMIDVFIAGAQKAGTTSLLNYLGEHSKIDIHPQKEMTYFYSLDEFKLGESHITNNYKINSNPENISLAKHAAMSRSNEALTRLREHNSNCKIIFCTRDPIKRAFSSYLMEKRSGSIEESFDEVIDKAFKLEKKHWYFNVLVELGCYDEHIKRILKHFPKNQLMIIRLEDLHLNVKGTVNTIIEWIGLEALETGLNNSKIYNTKNEVSISSIQKFSKMFPRLKSMLFKRFGYQKTVDFAKWLSNLLEKPIKQEKLEDYPEAVKMLTEFYGRRSGCF